MGTMVAALPALQRAAVWNVKQIEELWDSMLRQFPIGAFIVSPIDANGDTSALSCNRMVYRKPRTIYSTDSNVPLELRSDLPTSEAAPQQLARCARPAGSTWPARPLGATSSS